MQKINKDERIDDLKIGGYKLIQNKNMFCFGVDAVLLSHFSKIKKGGKVADLGCGNAIIPILLCAKTKAAQIMGIEIQEECAELAKRNVIFNSLEDRIKIICANLKDSPSILGHDVFDTVVSNPPYMEINRGIKNLSKTLEISRHEVLCDVFDVIFSASKLLKFGGKLFLIHRPERIADIVFAMRQNNIEPKRIRFVHPSPKKKASMILIEGQKGARLGCIVESVLYIHDINGNYTDEINEIYQREGN